ncbi:MAG: flagellar hook-associated protein FlgK [Deltaproteobacteria bacterium]|nr:MAG: flagellar hook-associated protein FlgK [Deltaproteobacteria bacterium]RLC16916.1 MAG: flagellar hook-associated protein FlgK [Deltaproteobacteria bacterium]
MTTIQNILGIGRTALLSQQKAIDITGRNIANADTEGYSRQRVTFSTLDGNYFTSGVAGVDIERVYDRYLENQLSSAIQTSGRWESQQDGLERVEIFFDESSGTGLSERLNAFWNGWMDLANNPPGQVERSQLLARSREMVSLFNGLSGNLRQLQGDTNAAIQDAVESINRISGQLADLNGQIRQAELEGRDSNGMQDSRTQLLKGLSELIDVASYEKADGTLSVSIASGMSLVENTGFTQLDTTPGSDPFQDDIVWVDSQGNTTIITDQIIDGQLKGQLEVRDTIIPDIMGRLDQLAGDIISEVNALHVNGVGLDGTQNDFFTGSSALDMAVNTVILNDPGKIAAADPAEGLPGGNDVALAIAGLQAALTMDGGESTFGQYYSSLVSDIGSALQTANTSSLHQDDITASLAAYRESVSGVSLDEEMVNLIKYQNAFAAAAQLINVADEMMETVVNMI